MQINKSPKLYGAQKQTGATLIGMLLVAGALIFLAIFAMKVFPAYQEYYSVKTVIHALNKEPLSSMSKKEIMAAFNKRADAGYVTVIQGSDLIFDKNSSGETVVSAQYQVVKPLFGNVSVLLDFATPSDGK